MGLGCWLLLATFGIGILCCCPDDITAVLSGICCCDCEATAAADCSDVVGVFAAVVLMGDTLSEGI